MVILILAVIWAAVLVPPALQNRRENRPGDSIASFRNQLHVLERTTPGYQARPVARRAAACPTRDGMRPVAPVPLAARPNRAQAAYRRSEARRRRRDIFVTLLAAAVLTFGAAVVMGGPVWGLHLVIDVLFVGYIGMLIKLQQETAEREMKVRYLPEPRRAPRVDPRVLRRSATN